MTRFAILLLLIPGAALAQDIPAETRASSISYTFTIRNPTSTYTRATLAQINSGEGGRGIDEDVTVVARALAAIPPWSQTQRFTIRPGERRAITASHNSYAIVFDVTFHTATPSTSPVRVWCRTMPLTLAPPPIQSPDNFAGGHDIYWDENNCQPYVKFSFFN